MRQVKTDLRGKSADEVLAKARGVLQNMEGNPLFPAPVPSLGAFRIACDELEGSILETLKGASHFAYVCKQQRLEQVSIMLNGLAAYVGAVAQGDGSIVIKAGLEFRRPSRPITQLDAPRELRARSGAVDGTIDLRWKPVHGARVYAVHICTGNPGDETNWRVLTHRSSSRLQVTGLAPLTYYWFRVEAVGARNTSPRSDLAKALSIGMVA